MALPSVGECFKVTTFMPSLPKPRHRFLGLQEFPHAKLDAQKVSLYRHVDAKYPSEAKAWREKEKMLVLSVGDGTQYSNKYDEKSNRLFSYFLMKGIINNNENTSRLYDYVKSNVQEKSYEMGASYEQVPVYNGNIGMKL